MKLDIRKKIPIRTNRRRNLPQVYKDADADGNNHATNDEEHIYSIRTVENRKRVGSIQALEIHTELFVVV